jgi:hypothetical protein
MIYTTCKIQLFGDAAEVCVLTENNTWKKKTVKS